MAGAEGCAPVAHVAVVTNFNNQGLTMRLVPLIVFLAACAAPLQSDPLHGAEPIPATLPAPPGPPMLDLAAAMLSAAPAPTLSAFAAPATPQPAQVLADRQLSVTVVGHLAAVQVRDNSWKVQIPPTGCRVVSMASSAGPVSAVWNIAGDNNADIHGQTIAMPYTVKPRTCLTVVSGSAGGNPTVPWRFAPTGSAVDECMVVEFVEYPVAATQFRGPAFGGGAIPEFFRSFPIDESLVDLSKLPSVIDIDALDVDWNAWGSYRPTFANTMQLFGGGRCSGDFFTGWGLTSSRVPWTQHQGYGTFYAGAISTAMLMLCSTATVEEKRPLAMFMVQLGIDQVGAFADWPHARETYPLGGHCWGRKPPIVLAGYLLGFEPFQNISNYLGPLWAEDTGFAAGSWWHGTPGWTSVWKFSKQDPPDVFSTPPSTWGDPNAPLHDTFGWAVAYMGQVVPAHIGTALACELMGLSQSLNPHLVQMVRQHVKGPNAQGLADLAAAGIRPLHWGTDYAVPAGFAVAAWRRYAQ